MNKYFAAILIALITMKLSSIIGDSLMHVDVLEKPSYIVANLPVEITSSAVSVVEKIEPIGPLMSLASIENGKKISQRCTQCHSFDKGDPHKLGPALWGIIGSSTASREGYSYSEGMKAKKEIWDHETLSAYLLNPKSAVPGTKMNFAGIKNAQERADLIAFISTLK